MNRALSHLLRIAIIECFYVIVISGSGEIPFFELSLLVAIIECFYVILHLFVSIFSFGSGIMFFTNNTRLEHG